VRFPLGGSCYRYDAARLPPYSSRWGRGPCNERIIMSNATLAEELVSTEELDELYKLDASENDPEDEEDEEDDEDDEDDDDEPEVMPQG